MGFGRAAGQLIEFRQRQCGAQFKTARCLTLGDVGSGQESLFCRGRIAGVAPQQDIAADAMQLCFERAKILSVGCSQRLVKNRNRSGWVARLTVLDVTGDRTCLNRQMRPDCVRDPVFDL